MRRLFFRRSWHLAAGAAGLGIVGAVATQMMGVETRPARWPGIAGDKTKSDESRVAERISLDPSIRETPALPSEDKRPVRARITDSNEADPSTEESPSKT